jgi:hypothetical protein
VLVGERGDRFARSDRADFLVGVEKDGEARVVVPAGADENPRRMEDDGDAARVVGDARPVQPVAVAVPELCPATVPAG